MVSVLKHGHVWSLSLCRCMCVHEYLYTCYLCRREESGKSPWVPEKTGGCCFVQMAHVSFNTLVTRVLCVSTMIEQRVYGQPRSRTLSCRSPLQPCPHSPFLCLRIHDRSCACYSLTRRHMWLTTWQGKPRALTTLCCVSVCSRPLY